MPSPQTWLRLFNSVVLLLLSFSLSAAGISLLAPAGSATP